MSLHQYGCTVRASLRQQNRMFGMKDVRDWNNVTGGEFEEKVSVLEYIFDIFRLIYSVSIC